VIDALLASLEREADAEIERVRSDARARAAALTSQAADRSKQKREATLGQREEEGRAALERALAGARHAARGRVLEARGALLERLFGELRAALPAIIGTAAYRAALPAAFTRTLAFAGDQAVIVHCAPALAALLRPLVKSHGGLTIHPDPELGAGFRIATTDGVLEVDGTLEGRAERLRPRLALEALAALRVGA
jgi:V/A-type H+-transporting ATPase subunit E